MQNSDYVTILIESLEKKISILDRIIDKNRVQNIILSEDNVSPDDFERNLEEKSELINQLSQLDDGFEEVYQRVKNDIENDKKAYQIEIKKMQELITAITEKGNTVQVQESRNRTIAEKQFSYIRERVKKISTSKKAATQYYQSMSNTNYAAPQFLDKKK